MKVIHVYFVAVALAALAGCRSSSSSSASGPMISDTWSESLMSRQIHLSLKHPADSEGKIRLVSVASDSTTTVRLGSGEQFSAKPGEYVACDQFGSQGLQLVSASPKTGAAELRLTWSETTKTTGSTISVTIPFDSHDGRAPFGYRHHDNFHVLLTNVSNKPVRLWQEWCYWGYYCLQIEVVGKNGTIHLLKKKPTNFLINFQDYVELQSGESVVWNVKLDPSVWEDLSWFPKDKERNVKIRAIFTVRNQDNPRMFDYNDAKTYGVWTGQESSKLYDFTLYGP
ncbi:MAG: hypothetical protein ACREDQ_05685 [Limisphaerales bacterium]